MKKVKQKIKSILVVDPDKDFCKNVRLFLENNYKVSIRQGLDYLDYTILHKQIDLLLIEADYTDINLINLLGKIKKNHPALKIILMYTYFCSDLDVERSLVNYVDDIIAKPFDVHLLKSKVDMQLPRPAVS